MTPSAALADYVFPSTTTVEQPEIWATGGFCMACPPGLGPRFERRDTCQLYRGLGLLLGQEKDWPRETLEQACDYRLEPVGMTFKERAENCGFFGKPEFKRYEKTGFGTPYQPPWSTCFPIRQQGLVLPTESGCRSSRLRAKSA